MHQTTPNIIRYSSTREAFVAALIQCASTDPAVCLVLADSQKAARATPFLEQFPGRWFDVGICEQNAVCFAAGLASTGLKPFFCTYGGFIAMRACEQIRTFVAYPRLNVKFVGFNGGIYGGEREGVTHMVFEDLGILRSIPGMEIIVPADADQTRQAVLNVATRPAPAYIRIGSGRDPVVFDPPTKFRFGRVNIVREFGRDAVIFANGPILLWATKAAELLHNTGINTIVAEVHTLKPLDVAGILDLLRHVGGAAVTVEDHNIIGGLGSAVAEVMAEAGFGVLKRIGLRDVFPESGEAHLLFDHFHMGVSDIASAVRHVLARKHRVSGTRALARRRRGRR